MSINNKIKLLRKKNGLSQEQLSEKIGLSRQAISRWETGDSVPDIDNIVKLSDIFNVSTDYLLKYNTENQEEDEYISKRYNNKKLNKNLLIGTIGISITLGIILIAYFITLINPELKIGDNGVNLSILEWGFIAHNDLYPLAFFVIICFVVSIYHYGKYYFNDI